MKRREFITLLGGAVAGWPFAVRAQQSARPVIGFLHQGAPETNKEFIAAFRLGLRQSGYVGRPNRDTLEVGSCQHVSRAPHVSQLLHRQPQCSRIVAWASPRACFSNSPLKISSIRCSVSANSDSRIAESAARLQSSADLDAEVVWLNSDSVCAVRCPASATSIPAPSLTRACRG
jgi:hypothetical protein